MNGTDTQTSRILGGKGRGERARLELVARSWSSGDVPPLPVGAYEGTPVAGDLDRLVLAREHVTVAFGPALRLAHILIGAQDK
jgi:hypothetical protein